MGFYKAYDMRGAFGADFTLDDVYRIGLALPKVLGESRWLVGRDGRITGPDVRRALVRGLLDSGAKVTDLGLCTTPMVYHFTAECGFGASAMVTASHNPPGDNGLKISKRTALPVGYADGLDRVESLAAALAASGVHLPSTPLPELPAVPDAIARYVEWQRRAVSDDAFAGLRYAVDCSNGVAALLVRELLPGAIVVNGEIDGRFPAHSPNPLSADARAGLSALVREKGLDFGIIFDGDADRAMFVDERGEFVQPDYLIPVVARASIAAARRVEASAPKVLHDVRTSRGAIEAVREMGAEPVMIPVGHAFAKPAMRRTGAVCGGELAGHYYFADFHGCDSGVLAARRVVSQIAAAKASGDAFSSMMVPVSSRYANSGELNFRVENKDAAIERMLSAAASRLPRETGRSDIDGVRVEFDDGWFNVRRSNTEPYLRLVAECRTDAMLRDWLGILTEAIG